jgi:adenylate cyclase class IV
MTIEREIRYFFPFSESEKLKSDLSVFKYANTTHELTLMFDNPNPDLSFYDKKIDGRLRLRIKKHLDGPNTNKTDGMLSWKQRILDHALSNIRHEHEVECHISGDEIENMQVILKDILKCPLISSYERERSHYCTDGLDITLDKFPFGLMLEIECENETVDYSEIGKVLKKLNLKEEEASHFSCDDMYKHLCTAQGKQIKKHMSFDDADMPLI